MKLRKLKRTLKTMRLFKNSKSGMELVQVAILVAIAIVVGLIFKNEITEFVNGVFDSLSGSGF